MIALGLTGGVGMGKSTSANFFAARGVKVIDTDEIARELVEPGQPALGEIQTAFGSDIVAADGRLKRDELAARIFADSRQRERLEAILHPRIRERWLGETKRLMAEKIGECVVVIPLLFETQAQSHFDRVICVACSPAQQQQRLSERGWTIEHIQERMAAQWPIEKKMAASDFVVWTDGSLEAHAGQIDLVLSKVRKSESTRT